MRKRYHATLLIVFCLTLIKPCFTHAQKTPDHDSSYYATFPGTITPRIYLARKYAMFVLPSFGDQKNLKYNRNSKLNLGIGATYNNFSLNVAYGFTFLNPGDQKNKTT